MLRVKHISKGFEQSDGATRRVLKDVTFDVADGQVLGLLGTNGSGKTTLLNIISGELSCDGGAIELDGKRLEQSPPHSRYRFIGRVHQDSYKTMAADLSVAQLLSIASRRGHPLKLSWPDPGNAIAQLAALSSSAVEFLQYIIGARTRDLSGGQRQLLAIATSMLGSPKLILLDEHTASLDEKHIEIADELVRGATSSLRAKVIAISHNRAWAMDFCDNVACLRDGRVVKEPKVV